jgi:sec-independent protein translocase protein TatA
MGLTELLLILVLVLLIFGATQVPKLARALGRSRTEYEKGRLEGTEGDAARRSESNT